jgi:hypothetical protein
MAASEIFLVPGMVATKIFPLASVVATEIFQSRLQLRNIFDCAPSGTPIFFVA